MLLAAPTEPYDLRVNSPLRLDGDRVYLLGHGFAPTFTVTYPDGETRTQTLQIQGSDGALSGSASHTFDPATGNQVTVTFPATTTRHVRVTFTANTGWPAGQASSLEVHGG